jgi:site-specific recombinase XerD
MASVKAVLYKSKTKKDGKSPIIIRVTKNRKTAYFVIDWITTKNWDEKNLKVKAVHPNSKRLNNLIKRRLIEADDLILELESKNQSYTAKQIIDLVKGDRKNSSFFDLADEYIKEKEKKGDHNRAISDNSMINNVKEFANNNNLSFQEIDERFLNKFKIYSLSKGKIGERTIMNTFVLIRLLYNRAIKQGIVEQKHYPFGRDKVKIKMPESIKIGLNENEIKRIEKLKLKEGTPIWHTRNVFLFSFYLAGIRISDVIKMKWSDIIDDRLNYEMGKNKKIVSLKMPQKTITIINFYSKEKSKDDFIFPELKGLDIKNTKLVYNKVKRTTKKFNEYLKKIGELAKIDKKITNHISRHSFGNIAGDKVSPQMLQKLYRHTNITTTMGYQSNFIHKDTDEALDSIINF